MAEIDNAIWSFCKNQNAIRKAVRFCLEKERGAGNTGYPERPPEKEKTLREQLLNAIRRNLPASSLPEAKPPKPNV